MHRPSTEHALGLRRAIITAAFLVVSACGDVEPQGTTPPIDAAVDAATDAPPIAPDAAVAAGPTRVETVGGGERLSGGAYTVELTVGVAGDPSTVRGGDVQVESGTPAHP